jgi:hypothetical protein
MNQEPLTELQIKIIKLIARFSEPKENRKDYDELHSEYLKEFQRENPGKQPLNAENFFREVKELHWFYGLEDFKLYISPRGYKFLKEKEEKETIIPVDFSKKKRMS